ncbi:MAG: hypothetical protein GY953_03920 [bacterium]|nr:hypothetical protein [bacterium]
MPIGVRAGFTRDRFISPLRYVVFQMAEVAVPRELFAAILERFQRFGLPPPLVQRG